MKYASGGGTRYFSIARWGDAKITLEQITRGLRTEKWLIRMAGCAGVCLAVAAFVFVFARG